MNMKIVKTIKMYIGGKFERSESGRSYPELKKNSEDHFARLCQASRKDFRNAVEIAQAAGAGWSGKSAYNRAQILYRLAEMAEGKREEFIQVLQEVSGLSRQQAENEFTQAMDNVVYYAGFCDKFQQIAGAVNPVAGPYHNFTTPIPVGVVALSFEDEMNFTKLMALMSSIIASGNTLIIVLTHCASILSPLSEVLATCDLPSGVVNILTGQLEELVEVMGSHREVKSVYLESSSAHFAQELRQKGCEHMKRIPKPIIHERDLQNVLKFVEFKSVWHPIGI